MPKLPYMQFYPTDFLMDVQTMDVSARGAWITLLCHIWHKSPNGTIELTNRQLANLWQMDEQTAIKTILDMADANLFDYAAREDADTETVVNVITSRRISRDKKRLKDKASWASGQRVDTISTKKNGKVDAKKLRSQKSEAEKKRGKDNDIGTAPENGTAPKFGEAGKEKTPKPPREFWNVMFSHVFDKLKARKNGATPKITDEERGKLRNMYDTHGAFMTMALFDLWMTPGKQWSPWAYKRGYSIDAFDGNVNVLLEDAEWKTITARHETKHMAARPVSPDELPIDPVSLLSKNLRLPEKKTA